MGNAEPSIAPDGTGKRSGPVDPPLEASTTMRLIAAGRVAQQRFEQALAELGLTMRHLGALGHLSRSPELSYSDLARRAHVTAPSMHATVRQLEDLGAVRRHLAGHGHTARLEVTEAGVQLLAAVRAAARRIDDDVSESLGDADSATLSRLLTRFVTDQTRRLED